MIAFEGVERLCERARHLYDATVLLEEIPIRRLAGVEALLDPVQSRHEHGREGEVGVGGRVRAAELDPLCLGRVRVHRDADAGAAIPHRVHEVHRRLVPGHQSTVRVGRRRTEGQQRRRVRQQSAHVSAGELRQPRVARPVRHQRRSFLPEGLMRVHPGAVVAEDRLRHERRGLPGRACDVLDDVLVGHDLVGHARERLVAQVDLALAAGGNLVVMELTRDPEPFEGQHHARAQVVQRVVGSGREVPLLLAHRIAEPGLPGVPVAFARVDEVVGVVRAEVVRDLVEDEELALRPHVGGVGDTGREQVLLCALGDAARVLRVRAAGDRIRDLADQRERRRLGERIEDRRRRVGHEQHVRLGDPLPAANRRAVEAEAVVEGRFVEGPDREGHVLPGSEQVAELEVHHLRGRLPRPFERLAGVRRGRLTVRKVLLRLFRCHAAPSRSGPQKKSPGLRRVLRLHCLGARLRRRTTYLHHSGSAGRRSRHAELCLTRVLRSVTA